MQTLDILLLIMSIGLTITFASAFLLMKYIAKYYHMTFCYSCGKDLVAKEIDIVQKLYDRKYKVFKRRNRKGNK